MGRKTKTVGSDPTPWTWEEIAALRKHVRGEETRRFLRAYGDRAKAALMAAGHAPGKWCDCPWEGRELCRPGSSGCPLDQFTSRWRNAGNAGPCSQVAMEVYGRMVKELGLLPSREV